MSTFTMLAVTYSWSSPADNIRPLNGSRNAIDTLPRVAGRRTVSFSTTFPGRGMELGLAVRGMELGLAAGTVDAAEASTAN
ncbi:hypothetical protein [Embleya sp. NBC_00896]|uniref:hypothetical protein n=1 Tax=Embleya sp. NBC_00896 TaxID=2975961 RepID=UPI0038665557|nr:hypothetical protein OG928_32890 [Embleya sp. NBC_00896]